MRTGHDITYILSSNVPEHATRCACGWGALSPIAPMMCSVAVIGVEGVRWGPALLLEKHSEMEAAFLGLNPRP